MGSPRDPAVLRRGAVRAREFGQLLALLLHVVVEAERRALGEARLRLFVFERRLVRPKGFFLGVVPSIEKEHVAWKVIKNALHICVAAARGRRLVGAVVVVAAVLRAAVGRPHGRPHLRDDVAEAQLVDGNARGVCA